MRLSEKQLLYFRDLLQKLKAELLKAGETGDLAEEVVELDQARVGRLSRMDAMQVQAMSLETGRRRRQQLLQVDTALNRIESGDYGDCIECGEAINPKRLEANPCSTFCIECAEALEKN